MKFRSALLWSALWLVLVGATASAQMALGSLAGQSVSFAFTTSIETPRGKHGGSGTITLKGLGGGKASLSVQKDDGSPPKTIPLVFNGDGSVAPDPSAPAPVATTEPDAAARAFMAQAKLAAHVGIAARKNADGSSFDVPVTLTPIGDGTPVPVQLHMTGAKSGDVVSYTGSVSGTTTTTLPPSGGLDPKELAKTAGVAAVAHHVFGPAGRIGTAVVMHRKQEEEKKEAAGPLNDALKLNVTANLQGGRFHSILGTQTDSVNVGGKSVTITSSWTFTRKSS